jgi:Family of unknown function (DUF6491)
MRSRFTLDLTHIARAAARSRAARVAFITVAAALLAACAYVANRDRERVEQFEKYAGPPVERINYIGLYQNLHAIDHYKAVVWVGVEDVYLLTVGTPCVNLRLAEHLGLSTTGHTINTHFDAVLADGRRCLIMEIRPVNYHQMRIDNRALEHDKGAVPAARD